MEGEGNGGPHGRCVILCVWMLLSRDVELNLEFALITTDSCWGKTSKFVQSWLECHGRVGINIYAVE